MREKKVSRMTSRFLAGEPQWMDDIYWGGNESRKSILEGRFGKLMPTKG